MRVLYANRIRFSEIKEYKGFTDSSKNSFRPKWRYKVQIGTKGDHQKEFF